ncbi:MAG TPA: antibiotic biosynthesis monooxygenase [Chloroflexota bacterium]|jgi:quinol monooxygenase YgiN|nr:antibiotic biosynthesis monooxygenase [Chloroflexota bacterium]
MAVRLIINITAAPGKGDELAAVYRERCLDIQKEPGCVQFEVFQSTVAPDRLVLLEHWADDQALAVHSEVNKTRAPIDPTLRAGESIREDYVYNRTR